MATKEDQKEQQKLHKRVLEKAHLAATQFKSEVRKQTGTAITTAFALVIALAWQDVIKQTVARIIENLQLSSTELVKATILYQSITAIAITAVCVLGIILATRWSNKETK